MHAILENIKNSFSMIFEIFGIPFLADPPGRVAPKADEKWSHPSREKRNFFRKSDQKGSQNRVSVYRSAEGEIKVFSSFSGIPENPS